MKERITKRTVQKAALAHGLMTDTHNGRTKIWVGHQARSYFEGGEIANLGSAREAYAFIEGWVARIHYEAREEA